MKGHSRTGHKSEHKQACANVHREWPLLSAEVNLLFEYEHTKTIHKSKLCSKMMVRKYNESNFKFAWIKLAQPLKNLHFSSIVLTANMT